MIKVILKVDQNPGKFCLRMNYSQAILLQELLTIFVLTGVIFALI